MDPPELAEAGTDNVEINEIMEWFYVRGFELHLETEDKDLYWANLARISDHEVAAPLYGRGKTRLEAARRARDRFGFEQ